MKVSNKGLVVSLVSALVLVFSLSGCSSPSPSAQEVAETNRSYPTTVDSVAVINPSQLSVAFRIQNDGTEPIEPSCIVKATDDTGNYKGVYMGIQDPIPAGVNQRLVAQLEISNEGAEFAKTVTAECSFLTTDTESSAGTGVVVSEITQCGDFDELGYYWAACFKVDAEPKTMMNCKVSALNSDGQVVAEMAYRANTLNDGTAIAFGNETGTQDTTEEIYKSIDSLDVSCSL